MVVLEKETVQTNLQHKCDTSDVESKEPPSVDDEKWRATERSLVRKLDMTLLPILWICYLFNYLDRNNIAQARLSTFERDLGLKGNQFNVAVSILLVGYMLMQLPSNMLLTRIRPSLYIPFWAAIWSILSAATAGVHNYSQLVVLRFFLGFVESPLFPGALFLLSCWYPRKELALRYAILYSAQTLSTAFSGLIAAGVFARLSGKHGLAGWKWLFIIEGAGSFAVALLGFLLLPDFPGQKSGVAKWILNDEEQKVAVERMKKDRASQPRIEHSVWVGLKLAVVDVRTWVFTLMLTANHSAYGFNNFVPTLVKGMHLGDNTKTLMLTAPPYLLATIIAFMTAWSSDRRRERGYHVSVPQGVACIGFIISVVTVNNPARYFAAFLYVSGCTASNATVFSWASATLDQTPENKASATAIINLLSQLGSVWSPYFFPSSDGPRYVMANLLMMAFSALSIVTCVVMKALLTRANRELRQQGETVTLFML